MQLVELEKEAKRFVNERRKECGKRAAGKLPKGYMLDSLQCPIAKALECVGVRETCRDPEGYVVLRGRNGAGEELALKYDEPTVVEFMKRFDYGDYPNLIAPSTPIKLKKPGERKQTVIYDPATQGKLK